VRIRTCQLFSIVALLFGSLAHADATLVFGPQTYERTMSPTDYSESFEVSEGGDFVIALHNGDAEESRASAATVRLNGETVIHEFEVTPQVSGLLRPVELVAGRNEIEVTLDGDPGAFLTLAIARPGHAPVFVHGRLILPWGRNDEERRLALAFKNGSLVAPRAFRALFLHPDGSLAGASPRITLPPRGSGVFRVTDLLPDGGFTAGSVEIYYAGPGLARLFGSARQISLPLGDSDVEPLEHAGHRVHRPRLASSDDPRSRR